MKINVVRCLSVALVLAVAASLACASTIVVNGNFSQYSPGTGPIANPLALSAGYDDPTYPGDFYDVTNSVGWTFQTGSGIALNPGYAASTYLQPVPNGEGQVAFMQNCCGWDAYSITQTVNGLVLGANYQLQYYLYAPFGGSPTVVSVGAGTVGTHSPVGAWTLYTDYFTATSASENLVFNLSSGNTLTGLTDVSMTYLPEGGSGLLYLLIAAAVTLGAIRLSKPVMAV